MSEETKNDSMQETPAWIRDNKLIISILIAAVLIAGSLIFLGIRLGNSGSSKSFAAQLAQYEQEQLEVQREAQAEQERIAAEKAKEVLPPNDDDHILGDRDALISIIEYSDFECPFCKQFAQTPKQLVEENPGVVNSVFRHFPLGFHDPLATTEAIASECAAEQGKFWEYHDEIFERTRSNNGLEVSELNKIARDLGLKSSQFDTCLDSRKYLDDVQADIQSGVEAGVTGTPGNIVRNNKTGEVQFVPGAYPPEALQNIIDQLR